MSTEIAPSTPMPSLPPAGVTDETQVAAFVKTKINLMPITADFGSEFVDVTPLQLDPAAYQFVVDALTHRYKSMGITHVVCCEPRGFIFSAPVALALKAAIVPIYPAHKIPRNAVTVEYASGFYSGRLGMQGDAIPAGARVVVIEDFVATGAMLKVVKELIELVGAEVVGCGCIVSTVQLMESEQCIPVSSLLTM